MGLVINTNVLSLNAQRNLSTSQSSMATALQRLSSGLRINSAKDDAAGLAITDRFTTQIRGLNQAVRNASDGISLSQTAESALGELTNNLQRIREIAVQSANSTNSPSDRAALDKEVQQRLAEIERIASQTAFNGLKVLDGTFGTSQFQVGANAGETISINLTQGVKASQVGQLAKGTSSVATGVTTAALTGSGTITVGETAAVTIRASTQGAEVGQSAGSAYSKAQAINASGVAGLTATASNTIEFGTAATVGDDAGDTYQLTINGEVILNHNQETGGELSEQDIVDAINNQSDATGVTATLSGANLRLTSIDGRDINIAHTLTGITGGISAGSGGSQTVDGVVYRDGVISTTLADATAYVAAGATNASRNGGTLTLIATENIEITGDGAIMGFAGAAHTITKDTTTLASVDVLNVVNANDAITRVDAALTTISGLRSTFGAIQNRFESTIANLTAVSENLEASRSRILDADFAAETASLTRAQILQQAGIAILAQANTTPQSVLALLQ